MASYLQVRLFNSPFHIRVFAMELVIFAFFGSLVLIAAMVVKGDI